MTLTVDVSAQGSGTVTSTGPLAACAPSQPNGSTTACGSAVGLGFGTPGTPPFPGDPLNGVPGFPGSPPTPGTATLAFSAVPAVGGQWTFDHWESSYGPCDQQTSPACSITFVALEPGSAAYTLKAVFKDTVGPTLTKPTISTINNDTRSATFAWTSNEALASASCRLDGGAWTPCTSATSHTLTAPVGSHTLEVRGVDVNGGNVGLATAALAFEFTAPLKPIGSSKPGDDGTAPSSPTTGSTPGGGAGGSTTPGAATAPITGKLTVKATAGRKATKLKKLAVEGVPSGATVTVTAKGAGAPKKLKGKGQTIAGKSGIVSLTKTVGASLKSGVTITIVVAAPGRTPFTATLQTRAGKAPLIG